MCSPRLTIDGTRFKILNIICLLQHGPDEQC